MAEVQEGSRGEVFSRLLEGFSKENYGERPRSWGRGAKSLERRENLLSK